MMTGLTRSAPATQTVQHQHHLLRHGVRTPAAFSSDRVCVGKKVQNSKRRRQTHARRRNAIVLAAAATDVATTTVQAIKKSVGGDIFVAGAIWTSNSDCAAVFNQSQHVMLLQEAADNCQLASFRSSSEMASRLLQASHIQ